MAGHPPDWQAELARQRNRLAADRTLMTWMRASLVLIVVGISLARAGGLAPGLTQTLPLWGLLCIGGGTLVLTLAIADHAQEIQRLQQAIYHYHPRPSLGRWVGVTVLALGILALWRLGT